MSLPFRIATAAVLLAALWFRVAHLERLPGINADEAWYGVQMQRGLEGDWTLRTPSGNPLNPFFSGPVLLLVAVAEPSYWVMRVPAVVSGIALIAALWFLLRRATDPLTAWIAAVLAASAPVNLAYSRIGWDPSQVPLAAALFCCFLLRRRWILAGLCLVAGVWIHPSAIFLSVIAAVFGTCELLGATDRREGMLRLGGVAVVAAVALTLFLFLVPAGRNLAWQGIFERAAQPGQWVAFVTFFGQLFSGTTVYRYFVGPVTVPVALIHDMVFWALAAVAAGGLVHAWRKGKRDALLLWAATGAAVTVFYLVVGLAGISPHVERYALWCVVPVILCLSVGLRGWARTPVSERLVRAGVLVVAAAALASFQLRYFEPLETTGGRSHRTFRTSPTEPKRAALEFIRSDALRSTKADRVTGQPGVGDGAAWIVAEDWWLYWPIAFLAAGDPGVSVSQLPRGPESVAVMRQALARQAYLVGFAGEELDRVLAGQGLAARVHTVTDASGIPILHVFRRTSAPPPLAP